MAGFTIISDIGNSMVQLFRDNMVPDIIVNADAVSLCSPAEKDNVSLGLYLYDIRESGTVRANGMQSAGRGRQVFPPMYLELYYMVTAYSMSDNKFRASEEQRILGKAAQLLRDHPSIHLDTMSFEAAADRDEVKIELLSMDASDKMKLWNHPNIPYKLSLYYMVSPVPLESTRGNVVTRVTEMGFTVEEQRKS